METVQVLLGAGIEEFRECGRGHALTRLVSATRESAPPVAIDWPPT